MAHTLHQRGSWIWIVRRVQCTVSRRAQPITATSNASAIILSFCSTSSGIVKQLSYGQAVHSADDWQEGSGGGAILQQVRLLFRVMRLRQAGDILSGDQTDRLAIRLPANEVLQRKIAHLLTRPTEGPSPKPIVSYHDFTYQAQSWNVSRRVVAKVEWHQGELFPRVGFIVTNLSYPTIGIVRFYNGRGTAEQWIKEGKYALNWTRLSCHKFVANQVRLGLFIMAYNLGNFLRMPESMKHWSDQSSDQDDTCQKAGVSAC